MEAADAGSARASAQRGHQRGADAVALPAVDYLNRDLGRLEVVIEADVAGDPDRGARRRGVRDQRLVMPVVDIEESIELARGERGLQREIALVARAIAEPGKREHDRPAVRRCELANRDPRHATSLTRLTSRT